MNYDYNRIRAKTNYVQMTYEFFNSLCTYYKCVEPYINKVINKKHFIQIITFFCV